jgi:enolase
MPVSNTRVAKINARQIFDSRGRPTTEADVVLADGSVGRACAPSGASRGRHEAWELRDGNADFYGGLGVTKAVENANGEIAARLIGFDAANQKGLDQTMLELDGTASLARLGANAILAVSMAAARAVASSFGQPLYVHLANLAGTKMSLPMPMTNILSGGAHAGRGMDVQDFLCMPVGARSYSEALDMVLRVRSSAAVLMKERGLSILLADEGGLSPGFGQAEDALRLMIEAFEAAKLRPGEDVAIVLDIAASELFQDGAYVLAGEKKRFASEEMTAFVVNMARRYPIVSIEDGLDQDDWQHWRSLTDALPDVQILGDDLFVTNVERITQGIAQGVANAALIKLNQNGTLSGTLDAIYVTRAANYAAVVSARSGETEDNFIADLAVGTGAGQIKIGSVRNSERLAKYNQLLRIEQESGLDFAGMSGVACRRAIMVA